MARYVGPVCRLCRREGMKLFLKGEALAMARNAPSSGATFRPDSTEKVEGPEWPATVSNSVRSSA